MHDQRDTERPITHVIHFAGSKILKFRYICQQTKYFAKSEILLCAKYFIKILHLKWFNIYKLDILQNQLEITYFATILRGENVLKTSAFDLILHEEKYSKNV